MITVGINKQEIDRIAKKAKKYGKEMKLLVAKDLAKSAYAIDRNAKANAQRKFTDLGGIVSQIRTRPLSADKLTWINISGAKYSAFVEFGTGKSVNLNNLVKAGFPPEWAMQFKGRGVKKLNLQPRPFFFLAIKNEQPKLIKRLEQTIKDNAKKF
jgi:hypothetical protein